MANSLKSIFAIVAFCWSATALAQSGNYFLSHHSPSEERFDYVCYDMAQDAKGMMYFATKAGIIEFDGRDWDLLSVNSAVYSIKINSAGEIYWAGAKGFGKIGLDAHGFQQVELLSDSTVSDVFQSVIVKDKVYFLSDAGIYIFDSHLQKTNVIKATDSEGSFLRLFELFGVVYTNTEKGVYKIEQTTLVHSKLNLSSEVIFYSRLDDNYIVGTADNKLYACGEDIVFRPLSKIEDQAYIDASVIINGAWLNRQLLALGTLRGGVIFINPLNGKTQELINYSTGLPDNEVFSLMADVNFNVWVAHDYGFTKISPFMPISSFSHYQGLQGNLLCAYSSQHTVYVGTSLGVFKLEKFDEYDELVYYVDVEIKDKNPPVKNQPQPDQKTEIKKEEEQPKTETKKGGLFSFLRRNKNKDKTPEEKVDEKKPKSTTTPDKPPVTPPVVSKPRYRREKRTEKILRSSNYVFKKVQGIEAKVTHLIEINGKLLASGLGGIYQINDLAAKPLLEEPVRYTFTMAKKNILLVATYNDQIKGYRITEKGPEPISLLNDLDDQIHYIFEGKEKELWLCGPEKIYRAEISDSLTAKLYPIEALHRSSDKTTGVLYGSEVVLANTDGFFHFNRSKNSVEKIDTLPSPSQYFAYNNNILYRDQHGWKLLGDQSTENNLQLLNIFDDLRFITSDKDPKNLWLISGDNELYKFYSEKATTYESGFPLFLKSVINQERKIAKRSEIQMDQEKSSVKFLVVQPDYVNPEAIEFRYFLKGMQAGWSEWSRDNNVISFPFLPNGEYTLFVEAKNIFGKVSELEPLSFEVLPPYWKRSWFYALEFAVFASLVMLSFRLSTRYRIVSRLLSLLTIILLIEFIQTAIDATVLTKDSPVIDFFIQVVVALLILPVEGFLRNLMLKSLDSSGKFYQFIVPKTPPQIKTKIENPMVEETTDTRK